MPEPSYRPKVKKESDPVLAAKELDDNFVTSLVAMLG
jgi:hypothetical protein